MSEAADRWRGWRRVCSITLVFLTACGGDFIADYEPSKTDTSTTDTTRPTAPEIHIIPPDAGTYEPDESSAPCKRSPPADGCPCAYAGQRDGVCRSSYRDGTCRRPDAYQSDESICDGLDNDCDGRIDESSGCKKGYRCRSGECEMDQPAEVYDRAVVFSFTCPDGEKLIKVPRERVERDGTCWRVTCWYEGRDVEEVWCGG